MTAMTAACRMTSLRLPDRSTYAACGNSRRRSTRAANSRAASADQSRHAGLAAPTCLEKAYSRANFLIRHHRVDVGRYSGGCLGETLGLHRRMSGPEDVAINFLNLRTQDFPVELI